MAFFGLWGISLDKEKVRELDNLLADIEVKSEDKNLAIKLIGLVNGYQGEYRLRRKFLKARDELEEKYDIVTESKIYNSIWRPWKKRR